MLLFDRIYPAMHEGKMNNYPFGDAGLNFSCAIIVTVNLLLNILF